MKKSLSFYSILLNLNAVLFLPLLIYGQNFDYSSDEFSIDAETDSIIFDGNVSLNYESFIFSSEKAILNRKDKTLKLDDLSFKVKDQFAWGEADVATVEKNSIFLEKAKFSLCPCEEKIWWIEAEEVDLNTKKNNIDFKKAKLKIYDKNLFYFPSGSFPVSGDRRSGFLLPEISASNKSGTDISIPYYFNLANNYDLTFEPRYISKRGSGGYSEFRYLSENYSGLIQSSFLSENNQSYDDENNNSLRWSVNFIHNSKFLKDYFLNINFSTLSDSLFLRDFGGGFNDQSDQLFVPQRVMIYNFGSNYEFNAKVNAFKLTSPIGVNQFQEVPEVKLNYFYNFNNFDLTLKTKYQSFRKGGSFLNNSKEKIERIKIEPEFFYRKKFLNLDAKLKFNYVIENFFFENRERSRMIPKGELKLSKDFQKISSNKLELLSPFFKFTYTQNKNQEDLPNINSGFFLDSVSFSKNIISGDSFIPMRRDILIGTDYLVYGNEDKLNISVSKLFGVGQRFFSTKNRKFMLPEPFQIKLEYKKNKTLNIYSSIIKDSNKNYDSFSSGLSKEFINKSSTSLNFIWIRNINSFIFENDDRRNIKFIENRNKFFLNKNISLHSKVEYDIENSNLSNLILGLEYENPGLIFGLALIESNELDWLKLINENTFSEYNQESFRIYFELKGLGSLGRKINQYTERKSIR